MCKDLAQWYDFIARMKDMADGSLLLKVEEREQSLIIHNAYAEGYTVYIRVLPNDLIKAPLDLLLHEKLWLCAESEFNLELNLGGEGIWIG
jgi:hypothetical protein